jgi:molybdopterin-binding protein
MSSSPDSSISRPEPCPGVLFSGGEHDMKISARNILKGKIVEVKKGKTTAHVRIDIGSTVVTASITNEAVDELKLKSGRAAFAVIKASDVMIAIP